MFDIPLALSFRLLSIAVIACLRRKNNDDREIPANFLSSPTIGIEIRVEVAFLKPVSADQKWHEPQVIPKISRNVIAGLAIAKK
jgi:hypothetical protein